MTRAGFPGAALAAAALLAAALGGCARERSSPRDAFEALRAAVVARDAPALDALTDSDTVSYRRAEVREKRALLERGDAPDQVLQAVPLSAEEILRGGVEDAAVLLLARRSPLFDEAAWYAGASVVAEATEGDDAARLRVRGPDGKEEDLWFLRERGRWNYDQFRTRRSW
jgi:hypothetical protein